MSAERLDELERTVTQLRRRLRRVRVTTTRRLEALEGEVAQLRRVHGAKYLTLEQAAARYGFAVVTLQFYVHRLKLFTKYSLSQKVGQRGKVVLAIAELDAYMEAHKAKPPRTSLTVVRA